LIGIEVKNSILLVDYTDQLRKGDGMDESNTGGRGDAFCADHSYDPTAIGGSEPLVAEQSLYSPLAL